jgi:hypothetical protein
MHWMSILGLIFITIGGILSFFGSQISEKNSQKEITEKIQAKDSIIDNINSNNIKLISQNSDLINSNTNVSASNNELINQNRDMLTKISQYQNDIENKNMRIKELEEKSKLSERGIESKIEFNGARRIRQGGYNSISQGPESLIFQNIIELQNQQKFTELLKLCDENIQKTPEWFTLYIFKAIALLNIDIKNKNKALDLFDYVIDKTTGDFDYAFPIISVLLELKDQNRIKIILSRIPAEMINLISNEEIRKKLLTIKNGN